MSKDFRETVIARVKLDNAFRGALLQEALQALIEGDTEIGLAILDEVSEVES